VSDSIARPGYGHPIRHLHDGGVGFRLLALQCCVWEIGFMFELNGNGRVFLRMTLVGGADKKGRNQRPFRLLARDGAINRRMASRMPATA